MTSSFIVTIIIILGLTALYLWMCDLVGKAAKRKGRSYVSWYLIALIFGLIIPAIIVAIMAPVPGYGVLAEQDDDYIACPFCAEDIRPEAVKCRHCGEMLNTA